jgi:hypothetical protein
VGLVEDCVGISDAKVTAVQIDPSLATSFSSGLETIVLELCRAFLQASLDVPLVRLDAGAVEGLMVSWMGGSEESAPEDSQVQSTFHVHLEQ